MWLFPHQQAEKSLQNQHVLSILQVGSHQLQYRFFRTNKPKSHHKTNTFCPITPTFISDRTDNRLAGPATARHKRMGMKKALPKECMVEMQNPHRWIAPRGAAARPKGLEPPTF